MTSPTANKSEEHWDFQIHKWWNSTKVTSSLHKFCMKRGRHLQLSKCLLQIMRHRSRNYRESKWNYIIHSWYINDAVISSIGDNKSHQNPNIWRNWNIMLSFDKSPAASDILHYLVLSYSGQEDTQAYQTACTLQYWKYWMGKIRSISLKYHYISNKTNPIQRYVHYPSLTDSPVIRVGLSCINPKAELSQNTNIYVHIMQNQCSLYKARYNTIVQLNIKNQI